MNLNELLSLIRWINQNIRDAEIIQIYDQLYKILNQNAQPNQKNQPFESQRNTLVKALRAVPLNELGINQIDFLDGCGILQSIGSKAADTVNKILRDNTLDIATAAQKITDLRNSINKPLGSFQKVKEGLDNLYESPAEEYEEALVHVHFT